MKNQARRKSGLRSSSPSSSVKPVPIYHHRDSGMKNQGKRKSGLRPSNRSSCNVCDPSSSVIVGICGSTIRLSTTNVVNEPLQSVILQPARRKRGRPKNKSVSVRNSSVDTAGEESPFKLCNIRKDPDILIGCKRKLSTESIDGGNNKVFKSRMKHRRNSCRMKSNYIGNRNKYMTRSKSTPSSLKSNTDDVPKQLNVEDCNDIDPFCPLMNEKLLTLLNFPQPHHVDGYQIVNTNLPTVSKNIRLGNEAFTTYGDLGKGAYARVVRASSGSSNVALKIEKPPCKWEFYIAKEIQRRVDPKTRSGFMDIKTAYIFSNGSVLVTEWAKHGSLLNIINLYKQHTGKVLEPVLSLHFAIEVTRAVEYLHKCKIIHGDIKPDNFVVRSLPTVNETEPCLMLIDFGRSIDMTLFPEGTKFSRVVTTEGFQCNEMKEQRSWTYQTDLYGLAGTIHCLLLGEYMKVTKKNDEWKLQKGLPRNMKRELWDPIFHQLLNVPSCDQLPNLTEIRKTLEGAFADYNPYVKVQYFNHISNIVMGK
uniref:Mitotic checkpoint serine/threonine-protein kinase BUB1 n=1 Tax=Lygus hesperus TaxID=30085 RepID=A0A0A9Z9G8_LYGHE